MQPRDCSTPPTPKPLLHSSPLGPGGGELHFSRCTDHRWTWDIPYIQPALGGGYRVSRSAFAGTPLCSPPHSATISTVGIPNDQTLQTPDAGLRGSQHLVDPNSLGRVASESISSRDHPRGELCIYYKEGSPSAC
ncbi:DUF6193 family natural product biosynthesis protein [Streptomyces sp. H27-D2]|uniref:DUF6193 family natural product biosynthesis protein n=1 Tax=Streptomyces sp. H27-D2 TaxID=3046304 RepID=UPI003FA736DE